MAATAATIQLQSDGFYLAGITRGSSVWRKALLIVEGRSLVERMCEELTGTYLGTLSREDAQALCQALLPAHTGLKAKLARIEIAMANNVFLRHALQRWFSRMTQTMETMEDIIETLQLGADIEFRGHIDESLADLRQRALI